MSRPSDQWLPDAALTLLFKLSRADALSSDLMDVLTQYGLSEPAKTRDVRRGSRIYFRLEQLQQPPPSAGLLFGDAINQLRSVLDHAVLILVEQQRGGQLTDPAELRNTAFPVARDQSSFNQWCGQRARQIPELAVGSTLADRLAALQPFHPQQIDPAACVPQSDQADDLFRTPLAPDGVPLTAHHPLAGLAAWSNEDKHRRTIEATTRSVFGGVRFDQTAHPARPQGFQRHVTGHELTAGTDLSSAPAGTPVVVELYPYPAIRRPDTGLWRPMVKELNLYQRYVAEYALPYLFTADPSAGPLHSRISMDGPVNRSALGQLKPGEYSIRSAEQEHKRFEAVLAVTRRDNERIRQRIGLTG